MVVSRSDWRLLPRRVGPADGATAAMGPGHLPGDNDSGGPGHRAQSVLPERSLRQPADPLLPGSLTKETDLAGAMGANRKALAERNRRRSDWSTRRDPPGE